MNKSDNPVPRNKLLAALPQDVLDRIRPKLEVIDLAPGQVLYDTGETLEHVYFPLSSIICKHYVMEDGATAEFGMVGNEGVVGFALFLGGGTTPNRALVQSAGFALRLSFNALKVEFSLGGRFHDLLLSYTQAFITQISQTAVCNRLHSIEQQLCRWLLFSHDRLDSDTVVATHDLISNMLGVRREGVTLAAHKLAEMGLIRCKRGAIVVLDRLRLEANACECYEVVRTEYARLLPR